MGHIIRSSLVHGVYAEIILCTEFFNSFTVVLIRRDPEELVGANAESKIECKEYSKDESRSRLLLK